MSWCTFKLGVRANPRIGELTGRTPTDTSDKSKEHSKEALEELGGSDTIEAHRNKPISKDAAKKLYGSRAAAG